MFSRWMQNPNEFEKPDREASGPAQAETTKSTSAMQVMAASIDLLSGIVGGLQRRVSEALNL